jgi:hypothetical protein
LIIGASVNRRDWLILHRVDATYLDRGDHLADPVDLVDRHAEDAAYVAHRRAGGEGSEGHDLRDVVLAVLLGDVADDFVAPVVLKVHVDVRHGDSFAIEEPLERQAVLQRVDVGDLKRSTRCCRQLGRDAHEYHFRARSGKSLT